MGEQRVCNAKVAGSNPAISTEFVGRTKRSNEKIVEQHEDIRSKIAPHEQGFLIVTRRWMPGRFVSAAGPEAGRSVEA